MVGGRVVSTRMEPDRVCLIVADQPGGGWHEYLGVDVAQTGLPIGLGDSVWWHGSTCYWTPMPGRDRQDVPVPRLGRPYRVGLTER